ncbi:MAG: nitrogen fixation protein NifQ [Azonexus sp.]|nr:nitrogen fixation protein NifQ [Azonexus sp.]
MTALSSLLEMDRVSAAARAGHPVPVGFLWSPTRDMFRDAIAHVRAAAEDGDLPLFVWTLGLPQPGLIALLHDCSLPADGVVSLAPSEYLQLEKMVPGTFDELRRLLFQYRTRLIDVAHADYLSRALAGACFGNRPLWRDLGLRDEAALSSLLATFFLPLVQKHRHCRRWKRQLFGELHQPVDAGFSVLELLLKCIRQRQ